MPNRTDQQSVAELDLACNFDIGYRATRTGTTCDRHATTVVYDPDAPILRPKARCKEHKDWLDDSRRGMTLSHVPRDWVDNIESATRYAR